MNDDDRFLATVVTALAALPRVEAVALGGSRSTGTARENSDWDFSIYYRGDFAPDDLRAIGWPGSATEVGGWGGGVFNGGGRFTIDGREMDIHYRDLAVIERELVRADAGEVHIEPLMFYLAGIPTYLVLAELAINRTLHGDLPRPQYPPVLRESAAATWSERAELELDYARKGHAPRGDVLRCLGSIALAATQYAHAILATRGRWVTNEKGMLAAAGLSGVDGVVAAARNDESSLVAAVDAAQRICRAALIDGGSGVENTADHRRSTES
ncbi:nucleotidyltransferase domain-containing protein [Herbiconiux sp. L3-i23]|uniref:nucleotidyltransferase domain-containing protein n=1 Tax=Herbiconiux sp. L3-i23 TaxID=2905871 RepID=UPI0020613658|nr:nucleotidyltransferase domain-containing protein [Herbiconiux sp. L3-i23]BDI21802.1 hypothetical protein L3i23_05780 [Herbiconiux sp. L3-i23]